MIVYLQLLVAKAVKDFLVDSTIDLIEIFHVLPGLSADPGPSISSYFLAGSYQIVDGQERDGGVCRR